MQRRLFAILPLFISAHLAFTQGTDRERETVLPHVEEIDVFHDAEPTDAVVKDDIHTPDDIRSVIEKMPRESRPAAFMYNKSDKSEAYPWVSADGLHLYYTHNASADAFFYCTRPNLQTAWSIPREVKIANTPSGVMSAINSCWLSDDRKILIFISGGKIYRAKAMENSSTQFEFDNQIILLTESGKPIEDGFKNCPSFCDNMSQFFLCHEDKTSWFRKASDIEYQRVERNIVEDNALGRVSSDGLSFIYDNDNEDGSIRIVRRKTLTESFSGSLVEKLFDMNAKLDLHQPCFAENASMLFFVHSITNSWGENNLYSVAIPRQNNIKEPDLTGITPVAAEVPSEIVQNPEAMDVMPETITPVKAETRSSQGVLEAQIGIIEMYPNPVSEELTLKLVSETGKYNKEATLKVTDIAGKVVLSETVLPGTEFFKLKVHKLAPGTYYLSYSGVGLHTEALKFQVQR
ncbi:MAG: T9SS type A sorting domain-containing protein [Bacteroidia bacterium]|nr:T9SS type A sorting domain-containing protein [Bacteroidia bacterium]